MASAATEVRHALMVYHERGNRLTMQDSAAMKKFLNRPMAMLQSPHKGAYETQSGAIQGILADMMDSFTRDYASTLDEEKQKQADYDALMTTKTADLKQLEETQDELKAAEEFLATTTDACKSKANEWAERSRLRTEELAGMNQAIDILTSESSKSTFTTAHMGFVQLGLERKHRLALKQIIRKLKVEVEGRPKHVAAIQTKKAKPQPVTQLQTKTGVKQS